MEYYYIEGIRHMYRQAERHVEESLPLPQNHFNDESDEYEKCMEEEMNWNRMILEFTADFQYIERTGWAGGEIQWIAEFDKYYIEEW